MMLRLCVFCACALLASSCVSYAGITAAPNGAIWIVRNTAGTGGATAEGVFVCVPRGAELSCSRVSVRGMD